MGSTQNGRDDVKISAGNVLRIDNHVNDYFMHKRNKEGMLKFPTVVHYHFPFYLKTIIVSYSRATAIHSLSRSLEHFVVWDVF